MKHLFSYKLSLWNTLSIAWCKKKLEQVWNVVLCRITWFTHSNISDRNIWELQSFEHASILQGGLIGLHLRPIASPCLSIRPIVQTEKMAGEAGLLGAALTNEDTFWAQKHMLIVMLWFGCRKS